MTLELAQAIKDSRAVLFVGAGVSGTLGLPTFSGLIDHIARELDYDPEIYQTHGDYLSLAEYYSLEKGSIGPLRSWMDREWHTGVELEKSETHRLLVELKFPIIYTTNYDSWLERAHDLYNRPYLKIINAAHLTKIRPDITQIVKFHGDFEDDASIVLTETSYFDRLSFESPLDIKLRSDLLGKSVLFIGYSLADINLRYMLYRLNKQWESVVPADARPKSFIFLTRPNPVHEQLLINRGIQAIVSDHDDPTNGLNAFLTQLLKNAWGGA
jgi:hypothetical protein